MLRLLLFLAPFSIEHLMHCTIVILAHSIHTLDRIHTESDSELQKEQVRKARWSTSDKLHGY
jgi:hypothetical protein